MDILKPEKYGFTTASYNRYCLIINETIYEIRFDKDGGWSLYWGEAASYGMVPYKHVSGLSDEQFEDTVENEARLIDLKNYIITFQRPAVIDDILKEL